MSSSERPRLRSDLGWSRFASEGQDSYIFKDPIALEYMRLDAITGTLALELDGTKTADDLLQFARERWPGLSFDQDFIADVIADLKSMKYLEDPFQKNALLAARVRQERAQISANTFKNLFSIPLGWVDPDRFLTRLYPYAAFMFRPAMVWLGIALFVASGYVVLLNRDHFAASASNVLLTGDQRLLGALLIWLVIVAAIIVHEMGHGLAVKHHGGKVHKMGFIMVFGMPCMFCDTSDTHLFPNWKHRVHVALAGTYTELYVAALATLVWWMTPADLIINQLAYNVMLFASISGIVFNYNPLIKMDGYFVLSDVLEMPNLQEDAFGYLGYLFKRYVLRMKVDCPETGRRRKRILATYGLLSIAYSIFFATLMYLFLRRLLIEHFAAIGAVLGALLLLFVLRRPIGPLVRTVRLFAMERGSLARGRHGLWVSITLLVALLLVLVPVPGTRVVPVELLPGRSAALVAPEATRLRSASFTSGQTVSKGAVLAVLDADSAALVRDDATARAEGLRLAAVDAQARGDLPAASALRAAAAGEAAGSAWLDRRVSRSTMRAPFAGRVLTISEPGLLGARLEPGDTVCVVGDFSTMRARAQVPESDVDDLRVGAPARIRFRADPGHAHHARVSAIEERPIERDGEREYRVWLDLADAGDGTSRAGFHGRARISTPARPLALHLWRWAARFIRADLWV